jgi:hypothetical protein
MGAVGGGASCDFDPAVALRRPVKDEELGESAKGARALLEKEKEGGAKRRWGITHFKLERRVRGGGGGCPGSDHHAVSFGQRLVRAVWRACPGTARSARSDGG